MRARVLALSVWAGLAASAAAIPYIPPPQPVYEAPIDRALENVAAMEGVEEAQRERLLGRLNLLAYARNDGDFAYVREDNQFNEAGSVLCSEAPRMRPPEEDPRVFAPDERCAQFNFALGPQDELPDGDIEIDNDGAAARLQRARQHYIRAVRLDPANLRARLGLAYAYDRMTQRNFARRELREILKRGLLRLRGAQADWEDHAVLNETAAHLEHLATTNSDRARMQRLRERLEASQPIRYVTPILVPMRDAPFETLTAPNAPVAFDFAGTGDTRAQGWLTPDAAWLVWDPEWRGQIRSGFDMIGARTWAVFWSDGFEALRALDDNRDGELTGAELGGLSLWRDANSNGVSEPGEVMPVQVYGIEALAVRGERTRRDLITAPAGVRFDDGHTRPLYDWTPGLGAGPVG